MCARALACVCVERGGGEDVDGEDWNVLLADSISFASRKKQSLSKLLQTYFRLQTPSRENWFFIYLPEFGSFSHSGKVHKPHTLILLHKYRPFSLNLTISSQQPPFHLRPRQLRNITTSPQTFTVPDAPKRFPPTIFQ